ncbi:heme NO-binding domain-containing protein [Shewanella atlantica]|uniref:heme NO-binding domain-containing protein n=1 Tax=Shewanella atlantica TaxID=271099 RepID=UPI003735B932
MKGIIFSEFISLVEEKFGLETCQTMLDNNQDSGIYTSAGTYDHRDLINLISSLSKLTGISSTELQQVYGESVFRHLFDSMPALEGKYEDTFDFIKSVEVSIHSEVKKLYPQAKPPRFSFISETSSELVMDYHSARCLSHVCFGLIKGCANYFNQEVAIDMAPLSQDNSEVRFTITYV